MTNAIDLQLIADYTGTMLWPMIALSNIAQGSAVLGMIFAAEKGCGGTGSECTGMYLMLSGRNGAGDLRCKPEISLPFVCGMIGSACAAVICVATGTTANAIGVGGFPGILVHQASIYALLCSMHGDCDCSTFSADDNCGKEKGRGISRKQRSAWK